MILEQRNQFFLNDILISTDYSLFCTSKWFTIVHSTRWKSEDFNSCTKLFFDSSVKSNYNGGEVPSLMLLVFNCNLTYNSVYPFH